MQKVQFEIYLPDQVFDETFKEEDFLTKVKEEAVLALIREKKISPGKGAEILGLHLSDLVKLMAEEGIPYFTQSVRDPSDIDRLLQ
jgi:predicted HTH domain antitoxin